MKKILLVVCVCLVAVLFSPNVMEAKSYKNNKTIRVKKVSQLYKNKIEIVKKQSSNKSLKKKTIKINNKKVYNKKQKTKKIKFSQPEVNNNENSGVEIQVKLTYYWTASPDLANLTVSDTNPLVEIKDLNGGVIVQEPKDLVKKISMEGSGFLQDGRLINLANDKGYPNSRFFIVDQSKYPWGMDSRGKALGELKTIAVDPNLVALGTNVYIPAFDGLRLQNNTIHNGCFIAGDTSYSFSGAHIDIFTGKESNYQYIDNKLNEVEVISIQVGGSKCN